MNKEIRINRKVVNYCEEEFGGNTNDDLRDAFGVDDDYYLDYLY